LSAGEAGSGGQDQEGLPASVGGTAPCHAMLDEKEEAFSRPLRLQERRGEGRQQQFWMRRTAAAATAALLPGMLFSRAPAGGGALGSRPPSAPPLRDDDGGFSSAAAGTGAVVGLFLPREELVALLRYPPLASLAFPLSSVPPYSVHERARARGATSAVRPPLLASPPAPPRPSE
jgi:hypothetical protein